MKRKPLRPRRFPQNLYYLLGSIGVWLCNRFTPRPATKLERALDLQYVEGVVDYMEKHGHAEAAEWMSRPWLRWFREIPKNARPQ